MVQNSSDKVNEEVPNTEVVAKAKRKRFTAAEKIRILREVDACQGTGEIGALLRREGIYSSYLTTWRRQRESRELEGLAPRKRGPEPNPAGHRASQTAPHTSQSVVPSLARGAVAQLRTWAPLIPSVAPITQGKHGEMFAELRALCDRAAALSPDCTDAELESIWNLFLKFTERYGLLPHEGREQNAHSRHINGRPESQHRGV